MTSREFEKTVKEYGFTSSTYLDRGDIIYEVWLDMKADGMVSTENGHKLLSECTYYELNAINDSFDYFIDFCTRKKLFVFKTILDDYNVVIGVGVHVDFIDEESMDYDDFKDEYDFIEKQIEGGFYHSDQLKQTLTSRNKMDIAKVPMIDKLNASFRRNLSTDAIDVFNLELPTIFAGTTDLDTKMRIAFEMVEWNDNIKPFEYIIENKLVSETVLAATFFMKSTNYDARILKTLSEFKVKNFEIPFRFPNDTFSDILFIENISKNWTFGTKYIGTFIASLFASNKVDSVDMFTKNYNGTYKFTTIAEYESVCIKGITETSVKNILVKFGDAKVFGNQTIGELYTFVNALRNYIVSQRITTDIYNLLSDELISGTALIVQKIYDHIAKNILQNPLLHSQAIILLNPYILLPSITICNVGCEIIAIFSEDQVLLDKLIVKEPTILDGLMAAGLDDLLPKTVQDIFLF